LGGYHLAAPICRCRRQALCLAACVCCLVLGQGSWPLCQRPTRQGYPEAVGAAKALCWFSLKFVLVQEWFDVRGGSAVDAKRPVVCADCCTLGPERSVLEEDARAWVLLPVEGYIGVAFTVHFFLSVWLR
jgi:hypothetical protein